MSVSAETLRLQITYTGWASRKLLAAAAALPPEHLTRDFSTADHSIIGTLAHTFAADRIWLPRITGGMVPLFISESDRSLEVLKREWPPLLDRWDGWAAQLTDEGVHAPVTYKDLKGVEWTQTLWKLVLHMVNHGTHHRGQVSGFMRSLGHTPPATDMIYFYREPG